MALHPTKAAGVRARPAKVEREERAAAAMRKAATLVRAVRAAARETKAAQETAREHRSKATPTAKIAGRIHETRGRRVRKPKAAQATKPARTALTKMRCSSRAA